MKADATPGAQKEAWPQDHADGCLAVRKLISDGHPRRAYDLIREGLQQKPDDAELTYLAALAQNRGRNFQAAERTLIRLLSRSDVPLSTLSDAISLRGKLFKERCRFTKGISRSEIARCSAMAYEQADAIHPGHFPAINAATMWRLAGDEMRSREFALQAIRHVEESRNSSPKDPDYWLLATAGEACLHLGRRVQATEYYARAINQAGDRFGDIASMKQQIQLLEGSIPDLQPVLELFRGGSVVVFSGSLIDRPDRLENGLAVRFPPGTEMEDRIRTQIRNVLKSRDCRVGFSSAACGSDLLFAEEALARGMELHIVLPFAQEDFYVTSVDYSSLAMSGWRRRCDTVLAAAHEVTYATRERFLGDDILFEFANQVLQGRAIMRAAELDSEVRALVVLDCDISAQTGAGAFWNSWRALGREADVISLSLMPPSAKELAAAADALADDRRSLKSMLFADVKGFSKLTEEQTPAFFLHFLDLVSNCLQTSNPPLFSNTWGDGLFLVFENPSSCAEMAISLCERMQRADFATLGLPDDMDARIGIHVGPVYRHFDPILLKQNFFGSHVNRTARIEPVTMPGCVYASEQMAALLSLNASDRFRCEYVGKEDLAKGYDKCALYHVVRVAT